MKNTIFVAFNPLSENKDKLIESALTLAQSRDLPIFLYGVIGAPPMQPTFHEPHSVTMVAAPQISAKEVKEIMETLVQRYKSKCKNIEADYTFGFEGEEVVNKVKALSAKTEPYMVMLEKTSEKSMLSEWFGTAETIVAQHVACPTLILPEGLRLFNIKRIIYALDSTISHIPHLNFLKTLASDFYAGIEIMATTENQAEVEHLNEIKQTYLTERNVKVIHLRNSNDFTDIQKRASHPDISIFAFPDRERSFFERLFNNDNTRHLVLSTKTPMIVF